MWLLGWEGCVAAGSFSPAETKQNFDIILEEAQFEDLRLPSKRSQGIVLP